MNIEKLFPSLRGQRKGDRVIAVSRTAWRSVLWLCSAVFWDVSVGTELPSRGFGDMLLGKSYKLSTKPIGPRGGSDAASPSLRNPRQRVSRVLIPPAQDGTRGSGLPSSSKMRSYWRESSRGLQR